MTQEEEATTPGMAAAAAAVAEGTKAGKDGLLSSIAALKDILMGSSPTEASEMDSRSTSLLQHRYEEQQHALKQIKEQDSKIRGLTEELQATKSECDNERNMRKKLQASFDSLIDHKKDLQSQLDLVTETRGKNAARLNAIDLEIKDILDQNESKLEEMASKLEAMTKSNQEARTNLGSAEARLLSSERLVEELKSEKEALKEQIKKDQTERLSLAEKHQSAVGILQGKMDEVCKERDDARKGRDEMCKEKDEAAKERDAVGKERDDVCKEKDQACKERDQACKERDETKAALETLRAELDKLKELKAQQDASPSSTLQQTNPQSLLLESKLEDMTRKYESAAATVKRLSQSVADESAADIFDDILAKKESQITKLQSELADLERSTNSLEVQLEKSLSSNKRDIEEQKETDAPKNDANDDSVEDDDDLPPEKKQREEMIADV